MYKVQESSLTGKQQSLLRLADGVSIPMDEANTDYQAYLAWLAEGNEPLPADEPANAA